MGEVENVLLLLKQTSTNTPAKLETQNRTINVSLLLFPLSINFVAVLAGDRAHSAQGGHVGLKRMACGAW